jgi:hypothetical protein
MGCNGEMASLAAIDHDLSLMNLHSEEKHPIERVSGFILDMVS